MSHHQQNENNKLAPHSIGPGGETGSTPSQPHATMSKSSSWLHSATTVPSSLRIYLASVGKALHDNTALASSIIENPTPQHVQSASISSSSSPSPLPSLRLLETAMHRFAVSRLAAVHTKVWDRRYSPSSVAQFGPLITLSHSSSSSASPTQQQAPTTNMIHPVVEARASAVYPDDVRTASSDNSLETRALTNSENSVGTRALTNSENSVGTRAPTNSENCTEDGAVRISVQQPPPPRESSAGDTDHPLREMSNAEDKVGGRCASNMFASAPSELFSCSYFTDPPTDITLSAGVLADPQALPRRNTIHTSVPVKTEVSKPVEPTVVPHVPPQPQPTATAVPPTARKQQTAAPSHERQHIALRKLALYLDLAYRDMLCRLGDAIPKKTFSNCSSAMLHERSTSTLSTDFRQSVRSNAELAAHLSCASHEDLLAHCLELHYVLQECLGLKKLFKTSSLPPPAPPTPKHESKSESFHSPVLDVSQVSFKVPADSEGNSPNDARKSSAEVEAYEAAIYSPSPDLDSMFADAVEGMLTLNREMSDANITAAQYTQHFSKEEDSDGMKVINDKYVVMNVLGRGSCAKVKLAFDQEAQKLVAMKIVRRPPTIAKASNDHLEQGADIRGEARPETIKFQAMVHEIAVMKKLRHRNIVSLLEVIDDPSAQKMYLIMKYIDKGPIGKVDTTALTCTKIDPVELIGYASQMAAGLHYLHDRGIIHRDLKPENILIDSDKQVYLADFGVSETLELETNKQDVESRRGTFLFLPPEILQDGVGDGFAVDMWSLGITLYALLVGELPFKREEEILKGKPNYPEYIGPQWCQVLRHLLARNPKKRLTVTKLRRFLRVMEKKLSPNVESGSSPVQENSGSTEPDSCSSVKRLSSTVMISPFPDVSSNSVSDREGTVTIAEGSAQGILPHNSNNTENTSFNSNLTAFPEKKKTRRSRSSSAKQETSFTSGGRQGTFIPEDIEEDELGLGSDDEGFETGDETSAQNPPTTLPPLSGRVASNGGSKAVSLSFPRVGLQALDEPRTMSSVIVTLDRGNSTRRKSLTVQQNPLYDPSAAAAPPNNNNSAPPLHALRSSEPLSTLSRDHFAPAEQPRRARTNSVVPTPCITAAELASAITKCNTSNVQHPALKSGPPSAVIAATTVTTTTTVASIELEPLNSQASSNVSSKERHPQQQPPASVAPELQPPQQQHQPQPSKVSAEVRSCLPPTPPKFDPPMHSPSRPANQQQQQQQPTLLAVSKRTTTPSVLDSFFTKMPTHSEHHPQHSNNNNNPCQVTALRAPQQQQRSTFTTTPKNKMGGSHKGQSDSRGGGGALLRMKTASSSGLWCLLPSEDDQELPRSVPRRHAPDEVFICNSGSDGRRSAYDESATSPSSSSCPSITSFLQSSTIDSASSGVYAARQLSDHTTLVRLRLQLQRLQE